MVRSVEDRAKGEPEAGYAVRSEAGGVGAPPRAPGGTERAQANEGTQRAPRIIRASVFAALFVVGLLFGFPIKEHWSQGGLAILAAMPYVLLSIVFILVTLFVAGVMAAMDRRPTIPLLCLAGFGAGLIAAGFIAPGYRRPVASPGALQFQILSPVERRWVATAMCRTGEWSDGIASIKAVLPSTVDGRNLTVWIYPQGPDGASIDLWVSARRKREPILEMTQYRGHIAPGDSLASDGSRGSGTLALARGAAAAVVPAPDLEFADVSEIQVAVEWACGADLPAWAE